MSKSDKKLQIPSIKDKRRIIPEPDLVSSDKTLNWSYKKDRPFQIFEFKRPHSVCWSYSRKHLEKLHCPNIKESKWMEGNIICSSVTCQCPKEWLPTDSWHFKEYHTLSAAMNALNDYVNKENSTIQTMKNRYQADPNCYRSKTPIYSTKQYRVVDLRTNEIVAKVDCPCVSYDISQRC